MMGVVCYVGCCEVLCVVGVGCGVSAVVVGPRVCGGDVSDPVWRDVLRCGGGAFGCGCMGWGGRGV